MASIKGIKLTGIQSHPGAEGYTLYAKVNMDNKVVGFVRDDAWGGPWEIELSKEVREEILRRYRAYIKEHRIVDELVTMTMTEDEVAAGLAAGTLPLLDTEGEQFVDPLEMFFSEVAQLADYEKTYKKQTKKGYAGIAVVDYLRHRGPVPVSGIYGLKSRNRLAIGQQIDDLASKKSKAYRAAVYLDPEDFIIR